MALTEKEREAREDGYVEGRRSAYRSLLRECLSNLSETERSASAYAIERQETISVLRSLCAEHGDNDWPDNLYIPDIITKHLEPYLDE